MIVQKSGFEKSVSLENSKGGQNSRFTQWNPAHFVNIHSIQTIHQIFQTNNFQLEDDERPLSSQEDAILSGSRPFGPKSGQLSLASSSKRNSPESDFSGSPRTEPKHVELSVTPNFDGSSVASSIRSGEERSLVPNLAWDWASFHFNPKTAWKLIEESLCQHEPSSNQGLIKLWGIDPLWVYPNPT